MVKKSSQKTILNTMIFAGLIIFAIILDNLNNIFLASSSFSYSMGFTVSICIYIGLYSYWTISVYKRIMQSRVRNYLMLIGAAIIFWITIRIIKWVAFEFVIFEDRLLWYMYYIPMIMLSVFFFFISLHVGENEEYRPSKKWNLLYIPAILLIIAVITNDMHLLAFDIDTTVHAYGLDYSHGIIYYIVLFFILGMVLMSSFIILKKFSLTPKTRKKALMPALVIAIVMVYTIVYIITPTYGIGYFLDVTAFGCTMAIALLESFIRTGLIHSNKGYSECFAMANIRAQILDSDGSTVYISESTLPLAKADFETLKKEKTVSFTSNTLSHIAPIKGGYVTWNSDVSQIRDMIKNLKALNDELYTEVDLLSLENDQKVEKARLEKLNDLHSIILKEILPLSEKIKSEIQHNRKTNEDGLKHLLFETSITSTYIKRKVNLILTQQTDGCIYAEDMRYCFLESFQLLRLYDKTCAINIVNNYSLSLDAAMASFDLYQNIIESTKYSFDAVYVTYNFDENNMMFAVQISGEIKLSYDDLTSDIKSYQKGKLQLLDETDSYYISLVMPK